MERASLDSAHGGAGILISHLLISLSFALFIIGCGTANETLPYSLTITEEGLGSIHPETPFNQINSSLSGFTFDKFSQISPDHPEAIYQVKRGKITLAQVISDPSGKKIASIHVVSSLIKNRHNQGVGDTLTPRADLICAQDTCHYADEPSVHYSMTSDGQTVREITFSRL